MCFEDKAIYIVNGEVVMALSGSRYKDGNEFKPLTEGKIQLQSEGAEIYFRRVELQPIKKMPKVD